MIRLYAEHQISLGILTSVSTFFWFLDLLATLMLYKQAFDAHDQIQFTKFISNKFDMGYVTHFFRSQAYNVPSLTRPSLLNTFWDFFLFLHHKSF